MRLKGKNFSDRHFQDENFSHTTRHENETVVEAGWEISVMLSPGSLRAFIEHLKYNEKWEEQRKKNQTISYLEDYILRENKFFFFI